MNLSEYVWPGAAFAAGLCAWGIALLLVVSKEMHSVYSADATSGIQRSHRGLIPRVGGLAIVVGVLIGRWFSKGEMGHLLQGIQIGGSIAFAAGFMEDLTKHVSVLTRLLATLASGLLASYQTGIVITGVDVPWFDPLLNWAPAALLFTAFAVAGVANAFNIIDGFNGLAAGTAILVLSAMGALSVHLGDPNLASVCLVLAAAAMGFMMLNWPFGRLFLGDGGAYFLGFSVAWVAVLLMERHPIVSAWSPLLICAYPVTEVLHSMLRRRLRHGSVGGPDRLHLHSLVKRRLVRYLVPSGSQLLRNSFTGLLMWCATVPAALWGIFFYHNVPALLSGLVFFVVAYQLVYTRLVRFRWWPRTRY